MAQDSKNAQDVAYSREGQIVAHFQTLAANKEISPQEASQALQDICAHYERLLEDSKLLTSVGDRLQRKLKSANLMLREQSDEIKRINGEVQRKNAELQETIDELTRAKASRRATTMLLALAIGLFLLAEIPEPFIEAYFARYSWGEFVVWIIKGSLALLLAPLQSLLEVRLMKQMARRKQEAAALEALAAATAPAPVPPVEAPAAGEAGAAAMSVAARRKAAAAAAAAAAATPSDPVPVASEPPALVKPAADAAMATMSVAARKRAEAEARKAAEAAQAAAHSTQPKA